MKYNINVTKFVWRQLRKPSRVTLDAATLPARLVCRDLEPVKEVKGGGGVTDKSKPHNGRHS